MTWGSERTTDEHRDSEGQEALKHIAKHRDLKRQEAPEHIAEHRDSEEHTESADQKDSETPPSIPRP